MKKLLTATLAIAMGATLVGALAACKNNDAKTAQQAITAVRTMYADRAVETPDNYTVIGQTKVGENFHAVNWSVTSEFANFANYVSVGEMDATSKLVTVSVQRAAEDIDYKLVASVTVGKATETAEFTRKVPATQASEDQVEVTLSFADKANRTSQSAAQQVWEQNGVKFTNDKASSSTDVADYANPVRIYQGSTVKIEYPGMKKLILHSIAKAGSDDYPTLLLNSINAANLGAEATLEGNDVTLALPYATDVLVFSAVTKLRLNSIDVVANKNGTTDADKVAGAKATLDIANKSFVLVGEYDLVAEQNGATVTWAVKGESANVSIKSGKLSVDSMPAAETEVILTATIKSGEVTDTKEITIKLVPIEGLVNDGTAEHPYTPSEAVKVAKTLAVGATDNKEVYVKGYVISCSEYKSNFNNFDEIYIDDAEGKTTPDAATSILIYRVAPDGTYLTTEGLNPRDLVTFKGKLQNYKADKQELTSGTCVARVEPERSDADIVSDAKKELKLDKTTYKTANEEVTLPTTYRDANLVWAVKETTELVEIAAGKLTIKSIPETEAKVTLTVTISYGSATPDTKDIEITLRQPKPLEAGTYKLSLNQVNLGKKLYFNGQKSGYYGGTTESVLEAADVVLEKSADGYTMKFVDKSSQTQYIELVKSGTHINFNLSNTSTGQWTYDVDLEALTWTFDSTAYCLGTAGTYNTISPYATSALSDKFLLGFETFDIATLSDAEKVALALGEVDEKLANVTAVSDVTLPAPNAKLTDVTFTWAIKSGAPENGVTVESNVLKVTALPAEDTTVTLTVTATCGDVSTDNTKDVTVVIKAPIDLSNAVVIDFSAVKKGSELTTDTALSLLNEAGANATGVTAVTKVYAGDGTNGGCIKFGTSSVNGALTITFDKKVTKVTINCVGWKNTDKINVTGSTEGAQTLNAKDGDKQDCVFTLTDASNEIAITSTVRAIIYSITVEFEETISAN